MRRFIALGCAVLLMVLMLACQSQAPQEPIAAAAQPPQIEEQSTKSTSPDKNKANASRTPSTPIKIHEPPDPHYDVYKTIVDVIVELAPPAYYNR